MFVRVCPRCGGLDVHRSRRRTIGDHLALLILRRPYRCLACELRYFSWIFGKYKGPEHSHRSKTKKQAAGSPAD